MAFNGLKQGLHLGNRSGLKEGLRTGIGQGLSLGTGNGTVNTTLPVQDPLGLKGTKAPCIYGLADYWTQPDAVTTTLTDIANTGTTLSCNTGGSLRPKPVQFGAMGTKYSMLYQNSQSYLATTSNVTLTNAYSFVMVCNLTGNTNCTPFHVDDTVSVGGCDIIITATDNTLQSTFYGGQAGSITNSKFKTNQSSGVMSDWILLSGTYKLDLAQGTGSEQQLYVNGMLQHDLVSSTFNVVTTTMGARQVIVGNFSTSSPSAATNFQMAAFVMFPYYMNSQERMNVENYFRQYYGYKF
jgi:hypothetical protein